MQLKVKVVPNAKKNEVKKEEDLYKIYLTKPPADGKANKALIEILSEYLKVKKSNIIILSGHKSKEKIVEIIEI